MTGESRRDMPQGDVFPGGKNYTPTPEEKQVFMDCRRESFYYRCVPLGVIFMGTTQLLVNKGILKPNKRFGALFKNLAAGGIAFILGKASYYNECLERIMKLPNSPMAEHLRTQRGIASPAGDTYGNDSFQYKDNKYEESPGAPKSYDELRKQNRLQKSRDASVEVPKGYDDLRKQNRREQGRPSQVKPDDTRPEQEPPKAPARKNKYGDIIED